jgi:hypothetical protein
MQSSEQIVKESVKLINEKIKSGRDYLSYQEVPAINFTNIQSLLEGERGHAVTQRELTSTYVGEEVRAILNIAEELEKELVGDLPANLFFGTEKKPLLNFLAHIAVAELYQHGECGTKINCLILNLMDKEFLGIGGFYLRDNVNNHAFLMAFAKDLPRTQIVADPFLNFCGSTQEYYKHPELLTFFNRKKAFPERHAAVVYLFCNAEDGVVQFLPEKPPVKGCKPYIPTLREKLSVLIKRYKSKNPQHVKAMKEKFNMISKLNKNNFDIQHHGKLVKEAFELIMRSEPRLMITKNEISQAFAFLDENEKKLAATSSTNSSSSSTTQTGVRQRYSSTTPNTVLFSPEGLKDKLLFNKIKFWIFTDDGKFHNDNCKEFYNALDKGFFSLAVRIACFDENKERGFALIQILLDHNPRLDINLNEIPPPPKSGKAAIHRAIDKKNWKAVSLLVKHGADPFLRSQDNNASSADDHRDQWDTDMNCCERMKKSCTIL